LSLFAVKLASPGSPYQGELNSRFIGDRTLIVATHRAPVLQLVDRLIWLEGGKLIADGPKAEVLKRMSGAAA
jgi:ATP-binding cassette subfamily C protein LapB